MLPGKSFSSATVLDMLRRRIWLIVIPPLITIFPALLYSSTVPDLYQSDMLIAIDPQRVPDAFVRSTVTLATNVRLEAVSVQVLSRTNLQEMIESLDLYQEERAKLPMEDVVEKMHKAIAIQLEQRPDLSRNNVASSFHVQFTYTDPNIAARVTQQLGSLFVQQNARDRGALASATSSFLESQLAESRGRLEEQERRLEQFREQHGKSLPTQMQGNLQTLQSLQLQVQAVVESMARDRDRKQMLERLYREAGNAVIPDATQAAAGNGAATALTPQANMGPEQQLAQMQATLASLELRYTADHPDIQRTKRVIETLKSEVEKSKAASGGKPTAVAALVSPAEAERRDRLSQMAAEIESLDRQMVFKANEEVRLRNSIADYQARIEAVPSLESEWVALTRDYDTQQLAYKDLLSKSGAARVAVDLEEQQIGEHFRIVDPATVPVRPLPSIRLAVNAGGLALGLLFGVGFAILLEIRDASYRSDTDVMEILKLPVLASVPLLVSEREQRRATRRRLAISAIGVMAFATAGFVFWSLKLWQNLI
jgi:polysaccharide chain length determinant protein (PEP-CTERM system associated)